MDNHQVILPSPQLKKTSSMHGLISSEEDDHDPPAMEHPPPAMEHPPSPHSSKSQSPSINPASPKPYPEPYSVPPHDTPATPVKEETSFHVPVPPPLPRPYPAHKISIWHRLLYPTGVTPRHRKYEHWVGRIGFGAKGLVYSFVGGMTCASATKLTDEQNGSPQGAFILIGDFPAGPVLLLVMLAALGCYIAWRWWEFFTFQGADATFGPFKNFFAYRLSPLISGCVYVAYSYYIIEILAHKNKPTCYPECWRSSVIGKIGLVLFGTAFAIACLTQLLNVFTKKWHPEMNWERCNKYEKWVLLILGHSGFMGRSGLFIFVSILMFRALRGSVKSAQIGNTIANGLSQFIGTGAGQAFMFIFGFLTLMYGIFALLCARYRYFPTPPPSGIPLYYRHSEAEARAATIAIEGENGAERGGVRMHNLDERGSVVHSPTRPHVTLHPV
eukprot:Phypoly_transcript_07803.p1 GENE.Phypoly_transcript_07803~~Phypoly_transcript_07803.p1  ORF type:complete len:443 (+),score=73.42 Phypoly_transcript_07803:90-1418(+)